MEGYLVHIFLAFAVLSLFNHINPCTASLVVRPHQPVLPVVHPHQLVHTVVHPHQPEPAVVHPHQPEPAVVHPHQPVLPVVHPHQPEPAVVPNQANIDWVRTSCRITPHPELCFDSLQMHAGNINSDAKLIAYTALGVTLEYTKESLEAVKQFSVTHAFNPVVAGAMVSCGKKLYEAVRDFQRSKDELEGNLPSEGHSSEDHITTGQQWLNQAWISDIQTIEKTCLDGFTQQNHNGPADTLIRDHVVKVVHLTSNALALLGGYISTLPPASKHP